MVTITLQGSTNVEELLASAPSGGIPCIPDGNYTFSTVKNEIRKTKAGDDSLVIKVVINQGQYANTEFDLWFNIFNTNDKARHAAITDLARLSGAFGFKEIPSSIDSMMNKKFTCNTTTQEGKEYQDNRTGDMIAGKPSSRLDLKTAKALPVAANGVFGR